jgi:hypothetical protein
MQWLSAVARVRQCTCDFCTGAKRREDNWCARCGDVQLASPKNWENLDVCEECERAVEAQVSTRAAEAERTEP